MVSLLALPLNPEQWQTITPRIILFPYARCASTVATFSSTWVSVNRVKSTIGSNAQVYAIRIELISFTPTVANRLSAVGEEAMNFSNIRNIDNLRILHACYHLRIHTAISLQTICGHKGSTTAKFKVWG